MRIWPWGRKRATQPDAVIAAERSYSSDDPITSRTEDRFNRWPFAQRIAEALTGRQDASSIVVGIYGAWGDGKTSVLKLMQEAFSASDSVVPVSFNPWHFQSEAHLVKSFFQTLADALRKKLATRTEEVGATLTKYGSLLSLASVSVLGGALSIKPGESVRDLGKALSTVELDDLRVRIEQFLCEAGKRIVVLIDDIDRLDREEIQAVFKLVKLSAGFENVSYVLAFDDEVVAASLGQKYGAGDALAGRNFLEKIIQVPLTLPPADRLALRQLAFEGVDATLHRLQLRLSDDDVQAFVRHFVDGLEPRLATPRQAKRYVNALTFAMPILKGEVHPIDQMLIEGIRVFYPKLYAVIRDSPDVCLGTNSSMRDGDEQRKHSLAALEPGLAGLSAPDLEAAKDILQVLFPRLKAVFGRTHYGAEWDERWQREQRICSDAYFARYFHYGIPPRDVSDQAVQEVVAAAGTSSEDAMALIDKYGAARSTGILIRKLRAREKTIPVEIAPRLAAALARSGGCFPRERSMYSFVPSTQAQAAILISNLVRLVTADRERLAIDLITNAEPLPFAIECFGWLRGDPNEPDRLLGTECDDRLGKIIASRIEASAADQPPYESWPDDASLVLSLWKEHSDEGTVTRYLEERLSKHPTEVIALLNSYTPTAWGLESGLSHKGDFMQESYKAVTQLVSPEFVVERLREIYGAAIDTEQFHQSDELEIGLRLARQFFFLHKRSHNSQQPQAEAAAPSVPEQSDVATTPPDATASEHD